MKNVTYLTAILRGTPVYVELTNAQLYGDEEEVVVAAFEDRDGQMIMHEATVAELTNLAVERMAA